MALRTTLLFTSTTALQQAVKETAVTMVQHQPQLLHLFPLLSFSYAVPTTYVRRVAVVSRRQAAAAAAIGAV